MALDIGSRYTGYCFSDDLKSIPAKSGTIEAGPEDIPNKVADLLQNERVERIIIGLPVSLKGKETLQTEFVLKIADQIKNKLEIPVDFVDERLTTVEATRILHDMGKKVKNRKLLNEISARLILETYLCGEK